MEYARLTSKKEDKGEDEIPERREGTSPRIKTGGRNQRQGLKQETNWEQD